MDYNGDNSTPINEKGHSYRSAEPAIETKARNANLTLSYNILNRNLQMHDLGQSQLHCRHNQHHRPSIQCYLSNRSTTPPSPPY